MSYSKKLKFESKIWGSAKPTKTIRQRNKEKTQCITNEWPEVYPSISIGADALASIFNSTIEYFYGVCTLMEEREQQEGEGREDRGGEGRKKKKRVSEGRRVYEI